MTLVCVDADSYARARIKFHLCARPRDRSRANRNSYVQMGCMQPVVPDSLGISVSLAGRN